MLKAVAVLPAGKLPAGAERAGNAILAHDERHLRRKAITLSDGGKVLVDLPEPVMLSAGDSLVLEDGRHVMVAAAVEDCSRSSRATRCISANSPGISATAISLRPSSLSES